MDLFKRETKFDFMGKRRGGFLISAVLLLVAIGSLATQGVQLGLDFTGGTLIELRYADQPELNDVRERLEGAGFDDVKVQTFGQPTDIAVRLPNDDAQGDSELSAEERGANLSTAVLEALQSGGSEVSIQRVEFVGPQVGQELTNRGGLAVLYALIGIFIYVAIRFEWKFSVGAVAALAHDVTLTMGVFSLLGVDFDLTVLAAVLAVIGYSLNDTIVVFDRIRENFKGLRKATPTEVINFSINQTISRTVMTSVTTLLVVAALFFLGGEIIHGFALALMVGVLVGTYSSIFIASALLRALGVSKQDLMAPEKEGEAQEAHP